MSLMPAVLPHIGPVISTGCRQQSAGVERSPCSGIHFKQRFTKLLPITRRSFHFGEKHAFGQDDIGHMVIKSGA